MNTDLALLVELADAEFDGESFNGPSLMVTLEKLSPEAAASHDTFEGYSAWETAIHCLYFKYFIARSLGVTGSVEPYPYEQESFIRVEGADPEAWRQLDAYLRRVHHATWRAIAELGEERLASIMPEWKIPYSSAIAWLATHDTYHTAQIRNMGVPGLRSPRD
jgi:uncharacterized damage-inducible protein DinB